jgi:hypothetical protein
MSGLAWAPKRDGKHGGLWDIIFALPVGVLAGLLVGLGPRVLLIFLAMIALLLIRTPGGRFALFVFGIIVTAGSSDAVSAPKLVFTGLALIIGTIATVRAAQIVGTERGARLKPLMIASGAVGFAALMAAVTGILRGASLNDVARDSVSYVFLVIAFPVAVDAAQTVSHHVVRRLALIVGVLSTVSYTVSTLAARGFTSIPIDRIVFGSFFSVALLFAIGIAQIQGKSRRLLGLSLAIVAVVGVLLSGTRSGLALFFGLLGLLGLKRSGAVSTFKVLGAGLGAMIVAWLALTFLGPRVSDAQFLGARFHLGLAYLQSGTSADLSAQARSQRYAIASHYFQASPMFGHGFGGFADNSYAAAHGITFYLDTPVLIPAKFGLVGTGLILWALVLLFRVLLTGPLESTDSKQARLVAKSFFWILVAITPFGAITENKGFASTLALLMLLAASSWRFGPDSLRRAEKAVAQHV